MLNWTVFNIYIKMDLALNNLQRLICHKTKPNQHLLIIGCILQTNPIHYFCLNLIYDTSQSFNMVTRELWKKSSLMQKILTSIQLWFQHLGVFGIFQVTVNFCQLAWTISYYLTLKHQCVSSVISVSWKCSDEFLLIWMQLQPSLIPEYDFIQQSASHISYLFEQLNLAFKFLFGYCRF